MGGRSSGLRKRGLNGEDFPEREGVENPEKAPRACALCSLSSLLKITRWKPELSAPGTCQIPACV